MKRAIVLFVFFFVAVSQAATEPGTGEAPDKPRGEKVRPAGEVSPPDPDRDKNWPRPFVPTERIGADTVVTFPADI